MKRLLLSALVMIAAVSFGYSQQNISGVVTDSDGEALIGVNVTVPGTNPLVGTQTDLDGRYNLKVPSGSSEVEFSYTGYKTTTMKVGDLASNGSITLEAGVELDAALVVGMGISREEKSLGYTISKVTGDEITRSGEVNAIQSLSAKAAGVQVIGSGGTPGASSKILIRGNGSFLLDNQPLIVIDGVPYNNSTQSSIAGDFPFNANLAGVNNSNRALDINPNDIESVNVLKGPAASAIYGSRAANGVLVITTKKGKANAGKLSVTVGTNFSIDQVNKLPELQSMYGQGNNGGRNRDANGAIIPAGTAATGTPNSWGPLIDPNASDANYQKAYDNMGAYFGTGYNWNTNIGISGGNEFANFRLSYGNTSQKGIVPNTNLNRNALRLSAKLGTDKFNVVGNASYSNTAGIKAQNGSNLSGVMLALTRMPANFNILGGDGPNGYDTPDGLSHTYVGIYDNPLWSAANNPFTDDVNRFTGGVELNYKPLSWLKLIGRLGADNFHDQRRQIFAIGANDPPSPVGEVWENSKRRLEINGDLLGILSHTFNENMNGSLTLGGNINHRQNHDFFMRGRNLTIPGFYNFSNASELYTSQFSTEQRMVALFFIADFSLFNMLYLNVTGRHDWSSTYGPSNQAKGFFYPSASASFVFTELMKPNNILSYGKVRFAYAQTGREPSPYSAGTYYVQPFITDGFTDGIGFPYLGQSGFGLSNALGNKDLRPERMAGIEAGFDVKLLKNRLSIGFTYYNQRSTDLLVRRPLAGSTGFSSRLDNIGELENQGIEIEADYEIIKTKNFSWSLGGNFTRNVNEVLSLPDGVDEIDIETAFASIGSYAIAGKPFGALYATRWLRDANGQMIIGANGLPSVDPTRGFIGNPYPDFTAGINTSFSAYGFTLSTLFDIRQGGALWNGTYARLNRIGRTQESADNRGNEFIVQGVKADGTPNDVPITAWQYYNIVVGDAGGSATENAVEDGSWFRLRELTLSYKIPFKANKYIKGASVYFTGRNLFLVTKYKGVDPETSLTGAGSSVGGFDYFNMPGSRSFIFGLNFDF